MWSVRAGENVKVGYEMPKRNVLICERNWVLESESGKEEH